MASTITRDDADGMTGYLIEQGDLKVGILDKRIYERTGGTYLEDMTPEQVLTFAEMLKTASAIVSGDLVPLA